MAKKQSCPPRGSEGGNRLLAAALGAHARARGIKQLLKQQLSFAGSDFSPLGRQPRHQLCECPADVMNSRETQQVRESGLDPSRRDS